MSRTGYCCTESAHTFQDHLLVQAPQLGLSSQELHLLLVIANHYGTSQMKTKSLYINVENLQQQYFPNKSIRTIQRHLRSLREKGLVLAHEQFKGYKKIIKYSFLPLFRRLAVEEPGSTVMPIGDKNDAGKSEPQKESLSAGSGQAKGFRPISGDDKNGALYNNSLINKLRMRINPTLVDNLSQGQLKRWLEKYNLPFDIIVELLAFCETLGRTDAPYLESVAKDWSAEKVQTLAEAETLMTWFIEEKEITAPLGLYTLNRKERRIYRNWRRQGFSIEAIKIAIDQALGVKNKFRYVEALLNDWHKKGLYEPIEIEKYLSCRNQKCYTEQVKSKRCDRRGKETSKPQAAAAEDASLTAKPVWNGMEIDAYAQFYRGVPPEVKEYSRQLAAAREKQRQLDAITTGGWR
ncbi:MAG: DnaD domain protein [bacterium]